MCVPEGQPFQDPALCFQRGSVHRRCADRRRWCPFCQGRSAQLAAGTKTLYDGVNTLNEGASQLNDGTHQLNDGLNQFNEEGISKLTGALDQDQLHGLKTVLDEMTDRLESYTSFAGAPEDAESSVKFVYKTAETVAAADNVVAETETVKEGNIFTRLWQRIVDLFKF